MFSKVTETSGFWQIPLDEETAKLTTFMTPFGRYFFTKLPFWHFAGAGSISEDDGDILQGINVVVCFMHDVVVSGDSVRLHDKRLEEVLYRLTKASLKLNKQKCEFRKEKT